MVMLSFNPIYALVIGEVVHGFPSKGNTTTSSSAAFGPSAPRQSLSDATRKPWLPFADPSAHNDAAGNDPFSVTWASVQASESKSRGDHANHHEEKRARREHQNWRESNLTVPRATKRHKSSTSPAIASFPDLVPHTTVTLPAGTPAPLSSYGAIFK